MCTQELKIGTIPAVLYGKPGPNIWLFVHGQGGGLRLQEGMRRAMQRHFAIFVVIGLSALRARHAAVDLARGVDRAGLSAAALAGDSAAGQQHRGLFFHAGFCRGND